MICKLNGAWHVWVAIKALAAALFFHLPTNTIHLIYKLPHFCLLWHLVGCSKAVVVLGLKWQITGSMWSGSSRTARSDLAGLLPDTKQSTSLSPTVMVTTLGDGAAILCFLAGGSASCWSNKLLPWSPGSSQWTFLISWFLASMSCLNGSSCDKLAFLFGCPPWRRQMIGWDVGLTLRYFWPSWCKMRLCGMSTGFSSWY